MRIACFANWFAVRQRPHHWGVCALQRGHRFDVYSPPKPIRILLGMQPSPHPGCADLVVAAKRPLRTLISLWPAETRRRLIRAATLSLQRRIFAAPRHYDVLLFCSPLVGYLPRRPTHAAVVYDCMDEWSGFKDASADVANWESSLAKSATVVAAVTPSLVTKMAAIVGEGNVLLLPNACEFERFSEAARDDLQFETQPVIGYVGSVESWFDWSLVAQVAMALPDVAIQIVGPAHDVPCTLPTNIRVVGRIPYEDVPAVMSSFDVGIIPFAQNEKLNAGISPIKLYEYLAAGKPVVGTALPEVDCLARQGIVRSATTHSEFITACRAALQESRDLGRVRARRDYARANSWMARWTALEDAIRDASGC